MPRLRLFYLDDEPDLCTVFADEFASADVEVITFTEPAAFMDAVKNNRPDLIFVDYRLPSITGDEIASQVQASIPMYLLTGDATVKTRYNFRGIFFKPIDDQEIRKIITSHLTAKAAA